MRVVPASSTGEPSSVIARSLRGWPEKRAPSTAENSHTSPVTIWFFFHPPSTATDVMANDPTHGSTNRV